MNLNFFNSQRLGTGRQTDRQKGQTGRQRGAIGDTKINLRDRNEDRK